MSGPDLRPLATPEPMDVARKVPSRGRSPLLAAPLLCLAACASGPDSRWHPTQPVWPESIGPEGNLRGIVAHTWSQGLRFRPTELTRVDVQLFPDGEGDDPSELRVRSLWFAPAVGGAEPQPLKMIDQSLLLSLRTTGMVKVGETGLVLALAAPDVRGMDERLAERARTGGVPGVGAEGEASRTTQVAPAAEGEAADAGTLEHTEADSAQGSTAAAGSAGQGPEATHPSAPEAEDPRVPGTVLLAYDLVPPSAHGDADGHLRPFVPGMLAGGRVLAKFAQPGRAVAFNLRPFPSDAGPRALVQFAETMDVWVLDLVSGELLEPVLEGGLWTGDGRRLRPEDEPQDLQLSGPAFVHDELGYCCPLWDYEAFFDAGGKGKPTRTRGVLLVDTDRDGRVERVEPFDSEAEDFATRFAPERFVEVLE